MAKCYKNGNVYEIYLCKIYVFKAFWIFLNNNHKNFTAFKNCIVFRKCDIWWRFRIWIFNTCRICYKNFCILIQFKANCNLLLLTLNDCAKVCFSGKYNANACKIAYKKNLTKNLIFWLDLKLNNSLKASFSEMRHLTYTLHKNQIITCKFVYKQNCKNVHL